MRIRTRSTAALMALAALSGCTEAGSQAPAAGERPAAAVGTVEARPEAIPVVSELPGRIAPTRVAEVRPRVGGIVVERVFDQGADVREGDPLFRLDTDALAAAVERAEATVARSEATLDQARRDEERAGKLVATRTSSQATLDDATAVRRQAEADLASARAALKTARLDLGHATVTAPISGRIGAALVTEGALVSPGDAQSLATIQRLDTVYADFRQPSNEMARLRRALREGRLEAVGADEAAVRLKLDDGSTYPHSGRLLFSEATVDPTSGQVSLRAEFPNPDGDLLPGMYVRVEIEEGVDREAIAVPAQAVRRDAAGNPQVLVVEEGKVVARAVTVAREIGNRVVVSEGVVAGDEVIADGFQKIGPGAPVSAEPWAPATKSDAADADAR